MACQEPSAPGLLLPLLQVEPAQACPVTVPIQLPDVPCAISTFLELNYIYTIAVLTHKNLPHSCAGSSLTAPFCTGHRLKCLSKWRGPCERPL